MDKTERKQAYLIWKKNLLRELPPEMICEDCEGSGDADCPHCGHQTECDTCDGDGYVPTSTLLTEEFYSRVMAFEEAKLEQWKSGSALFAGSLALGQRTRSNPLNLLLDAKESVESTRRGEGNIPKILLVMHPQGE